MSIDISKVKIGDIVTMRAEVVDVNTRVGGFSLRVQGASGGSSWVPDGTLTSHEPRGLRVGDRVYNKVHGLTGEVRYIEDPVAAWKPDDGILIVSALTHLERVG